jgi:hypothetical protein
MLSYGAEQEQPKLTLKRPRLGEHENWNFRQPLLFCWSGRPDTSPIHGRPPLSPGVIPRVGVRFCVGARDRCPLVVLPEFLRVAVREILVRDRLD